MLYAIARVELGMGEAEFLATIPAVLTLLLRRVEARDRKALIGTAGIRADLHNFNVDREQYPEGFTAKDFLPELPADRARRLRQEIRERAEAQLPPDLEAFAAWKASFQAIGKKP